jgi:hypothetical protein
MDQDISIRLQGLCVEQTEYQCNNNNMLSAGT